MIELLVVIAIIAVLASILVPAVSRALDRARLIRALSNEKQIGALFQQFANDFKGILPPVRGKLNQSAGEYVNYRYWFWNLYKYLDNSTDDDFVQDNRWLTTIFYCPNFPSYDIVNWRLGFAMSFRLAMSLHPELGNDWTNSVLKPIDSEKIPKPTLTPIVGGRADWHYGRFPGETRDNSLHNPEPSVYEWYNNGTAPFLFVDGHSVALNEQTYNSRYSFYPIHPDYPTEGNQN